MNRPKFALEEFCYGCIEKQIEALEERIPESALEDVYELLSLRKQLQAIDPAEALCHKHTQEAYEDQL